MTGGALLGAAGAHGGALFAAYLVTGPLRARHLDAALGAVPAAAVEAAVFAAVSLLSVALMAACFPPVGSARRALALGGIALGGLLVADAAVAELLCGLPAARHLARFATPPGAIQAAALALHAAAPWLWLDHGTASPGPAGEGGQPAAARSAGRSRSSSSRTSGFGKRRDCTTA